MRFFGPSAPQPHKSEEKIGASSGRRMTLQGFFSPWNPPTQRPLAWKPQKNIPQWWQQTIPPAAQALPAAMNRVRAMRILPSRYGLAFISLVFLSGLTPAGQSNPKAWAWTFPAWATIAAVLVRTQAHLKGVRLLRVQASPVFAGKPAEVLMTFDSGQGSKHGLIVEPMTDEAIAVDLSIDAARATTVSFRIPALSRGVHELGPLRVHTSQPMGVAHATGFLWPQGLLVVYPAPEEGAPPLPRAAAADRPQQAAPAPSGSPSTDADLLRPYRVGDSARHILWKASAKHRNLLVRDAPQQPPGAVALRWSDVRELGKEEALSRLARWVLDADAEHGPYFLDLEEWGPRLGPAVGPTHRDACLRALAEVVP